MTSLVSIVIPAHNAESTLTETIDSALAQTHTEIEIIVIDDGSQDATAEIVYDHAARDGRVRLIRQANAGVAAARNAGIQAANGDFIAPLDADDLWHPDKLRLQLERFADGPPTLGLVYNWYRRIDFDGRVVELAANPVVEGWVLHRHLEWNFVSNGSTPLIRRAALDNVRYETELQAHGHQGCEDYLIQLQIARSWRFACVPAFLTGYRRTPDAMSKNVARMIQSHVQMYEIMIGQIGEEARRLARRKIAEKQAELLRNRLRRGLLGEAGQALREGLAAEPAALLRGLVAQVELGAHRLARRFASPPAEASRHFNDLDPREWDGKWRSERSPALLARLERLDEAYGRSLGG